MHCRSGYGNFVFRRLIGLIVTKRCSFAWKVPLLLVVATLAVLGSQPWKEDPSRWNSQDSERILTDSPWAQEVPAIFALAADNAAPPPPTIDVPQGGMPNPHNGATDGRWDGGVSRVKRNGPPTLNVIVRWDSALPVRQALERENAAAPYSDEQLRSHYIITVLGLVPAGRYGKPALQTQSSSSDEVDVRNPEQMLENMMRYSRLALRDKPALTPDDARLDSATGALHLFFKREQITKDDKEVLFETRFGSLSISRKFRLKEMMYQGQLEL
jgi:hypothetical protein